MSGSVRKTWKSVVQRLGVAWKPLLAVHLVYVALGFVLLLPLTGVLVRFLIGLSGRQVLADQDIAWFLLSPSGLASLVLIVAVMMTIAALEQASMVAVGAGVGSSHGRGPALDGLAFAARRATLTLRLAVHLVARVLLLVAPFILAAAAAAWVLITDHDINYYLHARPPEFWKAVAIVGILLTAALVVAVRRLLAWSLVLPLVLFLDVPPAHSFGESARLTEGHRSLILRAITAWVVATIALGTLVLGIIQVLGAQIVPLFHGSLEALAMVVGALLITWSLANLAVTAFNAASLALIVLALSERLVPGLETNRPRQAAAPVERISHRLTAPRLALLLIACTAMAALGGVWLVNGIEVRDDIAVIAHRGAAGKAPENTLVSVRQAIEDGADWIEIDVQETADGEVVVMHDSDLMKLSGVDLKIWDGTLQQIRAVDIGSWFDPVFESERVPTLTDVLEAARGKARVLIELKYYGHDERLEQRVVDIVEAVEMASDIAIMSLEYDGIRKIRALRPEWTIGLLSATAVGDLTRLDADFLAVNTGMATPDFVRHARDRGRKVFVWTVNDPVSMSRLMSIGVDGIITDEPEMARKVREERANMTPVERLLVHTAVVFGQPVPQRSYRDHSP